MINCFSDASYSPQHNIAVIGHKINNHPIEHLIIKTTNNVRAECVSLIDLIQTLHRSKYKNNNITIFIDCESIINRIIPIFK